MVERRFSSTVPSLADLEGMRLLLRGSSVIDWHRLAFSNRREVERFLRVHEFSPSDPEDMLNLDQIRMDSVDYLTRHLDYVLPEQIAEGAPTVDLFLLASQLGPLQPYACMVLKVMHVLHHLQGKEVLFRLPASDNQIFTAVEEKVMRVVEELRGAGFPIVEFAWSRKEASSLITKLLAKKETLAAHIYDKLRFRLVVPERDDIAVLLGEMFHRLIPFNYVVPGQTVNSLVSFSDFLEKNEVLQKMKPLLQQQELAATGEDNAFSGPSYRVLNFVADLPIRVGSILRHVASQDSPAAWGVSDRAVVFVLTEFQIIDTASQQQNEQHENSHRAYKDRQLRMVRDRLSRGLSI